MAKQMKVCANLQQDFTDAEKQQARENIGAAASTDVSNKSEIKVFEGGPEGYVHKNLMSIYGSRSSSTGDLATVRFDDVDSNVSMVLNPTNGDGGKVLTVVEPGGSVAPYYEWKAVDDIGIQPIVTHYNASFSTFHLFRKLIDDTSGGIKFVTDTLSTPIVLQANKKYMIMPVGVTGNVEQTKTDTHQANNTCSFRMIAYDSSQTMSIGTNAFVLAKAEIANHYATTLGEYPPVGGKYQASYNSYSSIIEPSVDVTLDKLCIMNTGNLWGYSQSNPALLALDYRIEGIDVMEVR